MSVILIVIISIVLACAVSITDMRERKKYIDLVNADILTLASKDKNNALGIYNFNIPLKHNDVIEIGRKDDMLVAYYFPADYFTFKYNSNDNHMQYCINRQTLMSVLERYSVDDFISNFKHQVRL